MTFNQVAKNLHSFPAGVRLSEIINDLPVVTMIGPWDVEIAGITTDSRKVQPGWMFVATQGEHTDGHHFTQSAMERGASCVVVSLLHFETHLSQLLTPAYCQHSGTAAIVVHDTRAAVALLADRFHGSPARDLQLVGITGTNGKTTIAYLVRSVLDEAGIRSGLVGTVAYRVAEEIRPAPFTTPLAEDLHALFADMRGAGCTTAVMEVSSHALVLDRVTGIGFDVSVFTNLTQDHLDFHRSMAAYRDAKQLLFSLHTRGVSLINSDDPNAAEMGVLPPRRRRTYGTKGRPTFRMRDIRLSSEGTSMTITYRGEDYHIRSAMLGGFNAYNLAAAFGACVLLGVDPTLVVRGLERMRNVPGRFERFVSADGATAIVDYSHTPDALTKALQSAREFLGEGRLITVFGCGGDRDQVKRPLMGAAAATFSEITIVTSDNPRSEDPEAIIRDILAGVPEGRDVRVQINRKTAIHTALRMARPGDIVLVAGKGHEDYQIIGTTRRHFDDREIVRAYFAAKRGGMQS
ncbi:MAG: UDP-N-acetylmuramoyl-L-alanyl-D-glutamate--2,6-diaminopimelate ligase [Bacteroidetes bacterium]|nr:UDP-N-acetylmuramoyl-L-alanyl-D-glutamate--2,6-diaminopimelate ligase [Bacteroidota bacterium]